MSLPSAAWRQCDYYRESPRARDCYEPQTILSDERQSGASVSFSCLYFLFFFFVKIVKRRTRFARHRPDKHVVSVGGAAAGASGCVDKLTKSGRPSQDSTRRRRPGCAGRRQRSCHFAPLMYARTSLYCRRAPLVIYPVFRSRTA